MAHPRSPIVKDECKVDRFGVGRYLDLLDLIPAIFFLGVFLWPRYFHLQHNTLLVFVILEVFILVGFIAVVNLSDDYKKSRKKDKFKNLLIGLAIFTAPYLYLLYQFGRIAGLSLIIFYYLKPLLSNLLGMISKDYDENIRLLVNWTVSSVSLIVGLISSILLNSIFPQDLSWAAECVTGCPLLTRTHWAAWLGMYYLTAFTIRTLYWKQLSKFVRKQVKR